MFSDPITVDSEGWITLSDRPGLGLTLDDDVLKRTTPPGAARES
jgi:L-alanine-DL-glutamate epimerase-like enolase superfamily enzyme